MENKRLLDKYFGDVHLVFTLEFKPHYFASMYGSMVASTRIKKENTSLKNALLRNCFPGWREKTGYIMSSDTETIVLKTMDLYNPWMHTLAGCLSGTVQDLKMLDELLEKLKWQIALYQQDPKKVEKSWSFTVRLYHYEKGDQSWEEILKLLETLVGGMKEYHQELYARFWKHEEYQYYQTWLNAILTIIYQEQLLEGVKLLHYWTGNLPNPPKIKCYLNRFLGSLNPNYKWGKGVAITGCATIHIDPKLLVRPDFLFHEIGHIFLTNPRPLTSQEEIKRLVRQMTPTIRLEQKIPLYSVERYVEWLLEELLADVIGIQAAKRIFEGVSYSSYYAKDEILKPIYAHLRKYVKMLAYTDLKGMVRKALQNYDYKPSCGVVTYYL
ncbi:MAG: hypothetical protein ACFFBD_12865 [Candidatus Hodarchaeota archaeon]